MSTLDLQRDNIFLAALPDARTAARMLAIGQALSRRHGMRGPLMPPERLHMSLLAIDADVSAAASIGERIVRNVEIASFDVSFNLVQSFLTRTPKKPLVLVGDEGVIGARMLCEQMRGGAGRGAFEPHVTLGWDEVVVPRQPTAPIRWTVREIVLVRSFVGLGRHVHLARYPLRGRP